MLILLFASNVTLNLAAGFGVNLGIFGMSLLVMLFLSIVVF